MHWYEHDYMMIFNVHGSPRHKHIMGKIDRLFDYLNHGTQTQAISTITYSLGTLNQFSSSAYPTSWCFVSFVLSLTSIGLMSGETRDQSVCRVDSV